MSLTTESFFHLFFFFFFPQLSSSLALESSTRLGWESIGPTPESGRDAWGRVFPDAHVQRENVHPQVVYPTITFKSVERNLGHVQTCTRSLPSGPTHQRHALSVPFPLTSRLAIAAGFLFRATFGNGVYERCHVLVLWIKVSW